MNDRHFVMSHHRRFSLNANQMACNLWFAEQSKPILLCSSLNEIRIRLHRMLQLHSDSLDWYQFADWLIVVISFYCSQFKVKQWQKWLLKTQLLSAVWILPLQQLSNGHRELWHVASMAIASSLPVIHLQQQRQWTSWDKNKLPDKHLNLCECHPWFNYRYWNINHIHLGVYIWWISICLTFVSIRWLVRRNTFFTTKHRARERNKKHVFFHLNDLEMLRFWNENRLCALRAMCVYADCDHVWLDLLSG